jgi:hypothetical protein
MGGVRIETSDCIDKYSKLSLTAEGLRLLSFLGRLPDVPENQIQDKSKAGKHIHLHGGSRVFISVTH